MPNALRRCTLHQFSKGNNQLYLYMLYKYKQLLSTFIAHSIQRNRVYCWKWSSSPSARISNLGVLYGVKGQYVITLTLCPRDFEFTSVAQCIKHAIEYDILRDLYNWVGHGNTNKMDHAGWLLLSRFVCYIFSFDVYT